MKKRTNGGWIYRGSCGIWSSSISKKNRNIDTTINLLKHTLRVRVGAKLHGAVVRVTLKVRMSTAAPRIIIFLAVIQSIIILSRNVDRGMEFSTLDKKNWYQHLQYRWKVFTFYVRFYRQKNNYLWMIFNFKFRTKEMVLCTQNTVMSRGDANCHLKALEKLKSALNWLY